jgi:hypothetical protein
MPCAAKKTKITAGRDDDQDAIEAILSHITRYRVSTFAVLSRLPHFADESPAAPASVTA